MTSDAGGQPYDADLMAAVTELGTALRELVDASVLTTVPADRLRAAAAATSTSLTGGRTVPWRRWGAQGAGAGRRRR